MTARSSALAAVVMAAVFCLSTPAPAEERPLDFLHALQARGYGKLAVEYVQVLSQRSDLPEDIAAALDLERVASLRVAAQETANADEAAQLLDQAQTWLEKFLKGHANDPQAAAAFTSYGDIELSRAEQLISAALKTPAAQRDTQQITEARAALAKARPRLVKAVELFQVQRSAAPPKEEPRKNASSRTARSKQPDEELQEQWLEARFKLAMLDFQAGRSYANPKDSARKTAFTQASRGFDAIYQEFRTTRAGMYAHLWHGKALEELGDLQTALDVYDEVLVNAPDPNDRRADEASEALFADVEHSRLKILAQKGAFAEVRDEAEEWLRLNRAARRTPGFQGVSFELAKAHLALANKAKGDEQRKGLQAAVVALAEVAKVPGPHQQEAIQLRRAQTARLGSTELKTFDEAMAVASENKDASDWPAAVSAFKRALDLKATTKNEDQVQAARLDLARAQYLAGDVASSQVTAETLAREAPQSASAPPAAALAVHAAPNLYGSAKDKDAARDRLLSIAQFIVKQWPERSEADDARISLGKLQMARGEFDPAIATLEGVNNASDRRPLALALAAQVYWRRYLDEKQKPAESRNASRMAADRAKTLEQLAACLGHPALPKTPVASWPQPLQEAQLLQAEVQLEGGQAAAASKSLAPLLADLSTGSGKALDNYALRVFANAIRASLAENNAEEAGQTALRLAAAGDDSPIVNSLLIQVLQALKAQWKQAEGAGAETAVGQKETLVSLLAQVAVRKEHPLANLAFIGDTCLELDLPDRGRDAYQAFLQKSAGDAAFLKTHADSVTRVRARLVGLLLEQRKYEQALAEVDALLKEKPNTLDFMVQRGRILQAWAEMDPARYEEAVAQWTRIRVGLQRLPKKPPEYYEAIYNAAFCLVQQAKAGDKTKALQAEQILKSTLVLSPALDGPDTVSRFQSLLTEAATLQGRPAKK